MSGILMAHWDARDEKGEYSNPALVVPRPLTLILFSPHIEHPGLLNRLKTLLHPSAPPAKPASIQQPAQISQQVQQATLRPGISRGTSYQSVKSVRSQDEEKPGSSGREAAASEEFARFAAAGRGH